MKENNLRYCIACNEVFEAKQQRCNHKSIAVISNKQYTNWVIAGKPRRKVVKLHKKQEEI